MLEKIPGYNAVTNNPLKATSTAIDLPAVQFRPSALLWRAQLTLYTAMVVFSSVALLPFFIKLYPIALWLMFLAAIFVAAKKSYQARHTGMASFSTTQQGWWLTKAGCTVALALDGDIVLWSWVIIIPLRDVLTGKKQHMVLLQDSVSSADWRRLRVWLKHGLA